MNISDMHIKQAYINIEGDWISCTVHALHPENGTVEVTVHGEYNSYALVDATDLHVSIPRTYPTWMHAVAKKYGVTVERVADENIAFLQSEGYFETARDVIECHTFDHWMQMATTKAADAFVEPYHKGDLGYGL